MGLTVQLLPVSAVVPAGHRIRVAFAGHDASCFTRYGPAEETFTLELGSGSHLDLPVRYGYRGNPRFTRTGSFGWRRFPGVRGRGVASK
jgi:hypothetical protein